MESNKKNILIGTNTFLKNSRQDLCIESLKRLKKLNSNVDICLVQQPEDEIQYSDIEVLKTLNRDSSQLVNTDKKLPFVNDIFNTLADHSSDYFIFCNSDIILSQQLINKIVNTESSFEAFGISRIDIPVITSLSESFVPLRMEPAGFDCWVVSKQWWLKNKNLFKDYFLGRPFFDVHYTMIMLLNTKSDIHISNEQLIYHIKHSSPAFVRDECYLFNETQTNKFYADQEIVWGNISNNTFLKRQDYGRFLNFGVNETAFIKQVKNSHRK
jgi:hypothetical protein